MGDDEGALHAIFNWFKEVMMYYAFLDQGKDPKAEMARVSAAVGGGGGGGGKGGGHLVKSRSSGCLYSSFCVIYCCKIVGNCNSFIRD